MSDFLSHITRRALEGTEVRPLAPMYVGDRDVMPAAGLALESERVTEEEFSTPHGESRPAVVEQKPDRFSRREVSAPPNVDSVQQVSHAAHTVPQRSDNRETITAPLLQSGAPNAAIRAVQAANPAESVIASPRSVREREDHVVHPRPLSSVPASAITAPQRPAAQQAVAPDAAPHVRSLLSENDVRAVAHAKGDAGRANSTAEPATQSITVSIGRIDIRAVHENAKPASAARPVPQMQTLEEYLKQRAGASQ